MRRLYIFWFLHQTTTPYEINSEATCCISFDSYIKPQLDGLLPENAESCISFDSYIKPQQSFQHYGFAWVVYLLIPTSNHNFWCKVLRMRRVVYLLIPTSNHNFWAMPKSKPSLYIFWFLHQTTTASKALILCICCISFDSYIKPQQSAIRNWAVSGCISFDSYIKPQLLVDHTLCTPVVYLLIPTSNHNCFVT